MPGWSSPKSALSLEIFHFIPDAIMSAPLINMLTPAKKKSVVEDEKVDLVGSSHAQDEPMPTRFAPSSRISY